MKRAYSKPSLAVESFQLDAALAASCTAMDKVPLQHHVSNCTMEDGAGPVWPDFGNFGGMCSINLENDDECYQAMYLSAYFMES